MKNDKVNDWRYSIRTKLMIGFGSVIAIVLLCSVYIYQKASDLSRRITYEKMQSQAEYYMQTLEDELNHIRQLQMDFFNDRMLSTLIGPIITVSDYERREKLLAVQDRVSTIEGVSHLIQDCILYLPKTEYKVIPSQITRMDSNDEAEVQNYMNYLDGQIHDDGNNIFLVETGNLKGAEDVADHLLVITFSRKSIQSDLTKLAASEAAGAFLYQSEENIIIEHSQSTGVGKEILQKLATDSEGEYLRTQRITVNGENYLVFVGGYGMMGLFVEYSPEESVMRPINRFRYVVFILFVLMIVGAFLYAFYVNRLIHQPINELLRAFQRIEKGDWSQYITHSRKDEFSYLYNGFNEMECHMASMIEQVYIQTNLAQRAQMKQLQSQIAPHFLYNSFFSLSRKIKREEYEAAEALAKHLGTYFRYLTRNEADYVSLEQEVQHARSYAAVQGTRFVNRIFIMFEELPEKFRKIVVPRLILQPLLENAFEHGLENKVKDGILRVSFAETGAEYRIQIEDNGEISDEKISQLSEGLEKGTTGEITSFFNIHKRLSILYHGQSGLSVCRSQMNGLCVMVHICKEGLNESEFIDCR